MAILHTNLINWFHLIFLLPFVLKQVFYGPDGLPVTQPTLSNTDHYFNQEKSLSGIKLFSSTFGLLTTSSILHDVYYIKLCSQ